MPTGFVTAIPFGCPLEKSPKSGNTSVPHGWMKRDENLFMCYAAKRKRKKRIAKKLGKRMGFKNYASFKDYLPILRSTIEYKALLARIMTHSE